MWWVSYSEVVSRILDAKEQLNNGRIEPWKQLRQKDFAEFWDENYVPDKKEITIGEFTKEELSAVPTENEHGRYMTVDCGKGHYWHIAAAWTKDAKCKVLSEGYIDSESKLKAVQDKAGIAASNVFVDISWDTENPDVLAMIERNGWIGIRGSDKTEFQHKDANGKPIFDETTKENAEQLIYVTTYSPASDGFYPVPSYAGGLDAALTEVDTIITMKNGISNGINGAYIVSAAEGTVLDDTAKQKVTDELNAQATGAENSGTIVFLSANVKVSKMDPIDHEIYTVIDDKVVNKIVTAHNIPAILLEVTNSGGFNNRAAEMDAAINQFQKTTILAYQQKITKVFKKILSFVTTKDFDLKIIPFSLLDVVTENDGGDTNINS